MSGFGFSALPPGSAGGPASVRSGASNSRSRRQGSRQKRTPRSSTTTPVMAPAQFTPNRVEPTPNFGAPAYTGGFADGYYPTGQTPHNRPDDLESFDDDDDDDYEYEDDEPTEEDQRAEGARYYPPPLTDAVAEFNPVPLSEELIVAGALEQTDDTPFERLRARLPEAARRFEPHGRVIARCLDDEGIVLRSFPINTAAYATMVQKYVVDVVDATDESLPDALSIRAARFVVISDCVYRWLRSWVDARGKVERPSAASLGRRASSQSLGSTVQTSGPLPRVSSHENALMQSLLAEMQLYIFVVIPFVLDGGQVIVNSETQDALCVVYATWAPLIRKLCTDFGPAPSAGPGVTPPTSFNNAQGLVETIRLFGSVGSSSSGAYGGNMFVAPESVVRHVAAVERRSREIAKPKFVDVSVRKDDPIAASRRTEEAGVEGGAPDSPEADARMPGLLCPGSFDVDRFRNLFHAATQATRVMESSFPGSIEPVLRGYAKATFADAQSRRRSKAIFVLGCIAAMVIVGLAAWRAAVNTAGDTATIVLAVVAATGSFVPLLFFASAHVERSARRADATWRKYALTFAHHVAVFTSMTTARHFGFDAGLHTEQPVSRFADDAEAQDAIASKREVSNLLDVTATLGTVIFAHLPDDALEYLAHELPFPINMLDAVLIPVHGTVFWAPSEDGVGFSGSALGLDHHVVSGADPSIPGGMNQTVPPDESDDNGRTGSVSTTLRPALPTFTRSTVVVILTAGQGTIIHVTESVRAVFPDVTPASLLGRDIGEILTLTDWGKSDNRMCRPVGGIKPAPSAFRIAEGIELRGCVVTPLLGLVKWGRGAARGSSMRTGMHRTPSGTNSFTHANFAGSGSLGDSGQRTQGLLGFGPDGRVAVPFIGTTVSFGVFHNADPGLDRSRSLSTACRTGRVHADSSAGSRRGGSMREERPARSVKANSLKNPLAGWSDGLEASARSPSKERAHDRDTRPLSDLLAAPDEPMTAREAALLPEPRPHQVVKKPDGSTGTDEPGPVLANDPVSEAGSIAAYAEQFNTTAMLRHALFYVNERWIEPSGTGRRRRGASQPGPGDDAGSPMVAPASAVGIAEMQNTLLAHSFSVATLTFPPACASTPAGLGANTPQQPRPAPDAAEASRTRRQAGESHSMPSTFAQSAAGASVFDDAVPGVAELRAEDAYRSLITKLRASLFLTLAEVLVLRRKAANASVSQAGSDPKTADGQPTTPGAGNSAAAYSNVAGAAAPSSTGRGAASTVGGVSTGNATSGGGGVNAEASKLLSALSPPIAFISADALSAPEVSTMPMRFGHAFFVILVPPPAPGSPMSPVVGLANTAKLPDNLPVPTGLNVRYLQLPARPSDIKKTIRLARSFLERITANSFFGFDPLQEAFWTVDGAAFEPMRPQALAALPPPVSAPSPTAPGRPSRPPRQAQQLDLGASMTHQQSSIATSDLPEAVFQWSIVSKLDDQSTQMERLGTGAFAVVYRLRVAHMPRDMALKRIMLYNDRDRADWRSGSEQEHRLALRAQRTSDFETNCAQFFQLDHPNIVRPFFAHEYTLKDRVSTYVDVFMEYCEDGSLGSLIRKGLPTGDQIYDFVRDVLRGLNHLHSQGIIHLDIKPENIMIRDGTAKIADFGTARRLRNAEQGGLELGTRAYWAPEVMLNEPLSTRADIFSFGVSFAEMLGLMPEHLVGDGVYDIVVNQFRAIFQDRQRFPSEFATRLFYNCESMQDVTTTMSRERLNSVADIINLLNCCLCIFPEARLSAEKLLKHPIFADRERFVQEVEILMATAVAASAQQPGVRSSVFSFQSNMPPSGGGPGVSPGHDNRSQRLTSTNTRNINSVSLGMGASVNKRPFESTTSINRPLSMRLGPNQSGTGDPAATPLEALTPKLRSLAPSMQSPGASSRAVDVPFGHALTAAGTGGAGGSFSSRSGHMRPSAFEARAPESTTSHPAMHSSSGNAGASSSSGLLPHAPLTGSMAAAGTQGARSTPPRPHSPQTKDMHQQPASHSLSDRSQVGMDRSGNSHRSSPKVQVLAPVPEDGPGDGTPRERTVDEAEGPAEQAPATVQPVAPEDDKPYFPFAVPGVAPAPSSPPATGAFPRPTVAPSAPAPSQPQSGGRPSMMSAFGGEGAFSPFPPPATAGQQAAAPLATSRSAAPAEAPK